MKFEKLSFAEAVKYFKDKVSMPADEYYKFVKELRTLGFSLSYVKNIEAIEKIKELLSEAQESGKTFLEFKDAIKEKVGTASFEKFYDFHLQTVFVTNLQTSYSVGRYQQMQRIKKLRQFWQYHHSGSANPRQSHLALDGKVFAADDKIWDTIYPPNGWGCGCGATSISREEMDEEKLWDNYETNRKKEIQEKYIDNLKKEMTSKKEKGFLTNPAKRRWQPDVKDIPVEYQEDYKKLLLQREKLKYK